MRPVGYTLGLHDTRADVLFVLVLASNRRVEFASMWDILRCRVISLIHLISCRPSFQCGFEEDEVFELRIRNTMFEFGIYSIDGQDRTGHEMQRLRLAGLQIDLSALNVQQ